MALAQGLGMGLQFGSQLGGAVTEAEAIKSQAAYQKQSLIFNSKLADIQGKEAVKIGEKDANMVRKKGKQIIGAQRTAYAGQGVEVDAGSALDIQKETAKLAEIDAITIKNNAAREAWGYKIEALNMRGQASFAEMAARFKAKQTLITGGLNAFGTLASGASKFKGGGGGGSDGGGTPGNSAGSSGDFGGFA